MYICGIVAVQKIQGDGMPTQIFRRARDMGVHAQNVQKL